MQADRHVHGLNHCLCQLLSAAVAWLLLHCRCLQSSDSLQHDTTAAA